ncbi:hypothetical protein SASPL_138368 [Salvia splendens]|uniref:Uncharacterized protein n=1 Tax=Salvia splendens TaxID=180675 RepID=A0A8X8WW91_SALSN|nr:uncharacterized protein LOC121764006 [Salvia splendens]KAG6401510.1 hypothetical protein SASPL_138368 [Salvia splendens]
MEGSVPSDTLAYQDLRSSSESVTTPNIQTQYSSGDLSMNDLKMCLNEFVSVEEVGVSSGGLLDGNNSKCDLVMEDDCKDSAESGDNLPDSTSSATRYKLASAVKGSREKQGIPLMKQYKHMMAVAGNLERTSRKVVGNPREGAKAKAKARSKLGRMVAPPPNSSQYMMTVWLASLSLRQAPSISTLSTQIHYVEAAFSRNQPRICTSPLRRPHDDVH